MVFFLKELTIYASQVGDERPLSACCLSPDASLAATGSWSSLIKVWNVDTFEQVSLLKGHKERICGLQFHPQALSAQSASSVSQRKLKQKGVTDWEMEHQSHEGKSINVIFILSKKKSRVNWVI